MLKHAMRLAWIPAGGARMEKKEHSQETTHTGGTLVFNKPNGTGQVRGKSCITLRLFVQGN